jgi:hypothetical protein
MFGWVESHAVRPFVTTAGRLNPRFGVPMFELILNVGFRVSACDVDRDAEPHSNTPYPMRSWTVPMQSGVGGCFDSFSVAVEDCIKPIAVEHMRPFVSSIPYAHRFKLVGGSTESDNRVLYVLRFVGVESFVAGHASV